MLHSKQASSVESLVCGQPLYGQFPLILKNINSFYIKVIDIVKYLKGICFNQWNKVSVSTNAGYATLNFPISFSGIYIATPTNYTNRNSNREIVCNAIGTCSNTTINVAWHSVSNEAPIVYAGYIAIGI